MFLDLAGPAGRLEAILAEPEGAAPRFAAVVCHPHPLFGGTMHNHATYRLARALVSRGGVTLRFNFRGVGRSEGAHDEGRGEVDDALAAVAFLSDRHPSLPRWATGFSFGARIALEAARRDPGVSRALVLGLAVRATPHEFVRDLPLPVAVIQAEHDELGTPYEVRDLLAGSAGPRRVTVVPGASHLFTEDLDALEREVGEAAAWLLARSRPGSPA
ncbi:MAG: alpha/beta hydrolase [Deltaproteobacteria bacterium]|nr:alpha/beta hydrolase [Deltaproteobacteria bacterium]